MLRLILKISVSGWALALVWQKMGQCSGTFLELLLPGVDHWCCIMLPAESIGPKKIKTTHKQDTRLVQSIALFAPPPFPCKEICVLGASKWLRRNISGSLPSGASLGSLLPIYVVLSVAKLKAWLYHSTGPCANNCFLTSSASLCTFLLKHPFRMVTILLGSSTALLLISGVFSCPDLPCHFKVNAPWSLRFWVASQKPVSPLPVSSSTGLPDAHP